MTESKNARIKHLVGARGIKPTQFALDVGVKTSTMFSIYKGKTQFENIRVGTFAAIAGGLGLSLDELWTGYRPENLSVDEARLLILFRQANEMGRAMIMNMAEKADRRDPDSLFSGSGEGVRFYHCDPFPDD